MRIAVLAVVCLLPALAQADTVVAKSIIRAKSIITAAQISLRDDVTTGAASDVNTVIGQEARSTIYPGRVIRFSDIGPPALVERNQIVMLQFARGGLAISVEGRALDRAGAGESLRVMNIGSRTTVFGTVQPNGTVTVTP